MNLKNSLQAPVAAKKTHLHEIHGHQRRDDYFWLRDDERQAPEVLAYLNEENSFTQAVMAPLEQLQQQLYDEMVARQEPALESVPYFKNGFWYISRFEEGKDYNVYTRRQGNMDAPEQLLLDCNERAKGHSYYDLGEITLSSNAMLMAYSEDTLSRRQYTLRFKNLATGEDYPESIKDTAGAVWANDNKTLFYVKQHPETLLPYQVYRHTLGTDAKDDQLIYQEDDDSFYLHLYKTRSEKYLVLGITSTTTCDCLMLDANQPHEAFTRFVPRVRGHEYTVDHFNDSFYILTNTEGKNFSLMTSQKKSQEDTNTWRSIIPAREDVLLEGFDLMRDYLVVEERRAGLPQLRQIHYQSGASKTLQFNDPAYTVFSHYNPDGKSNKFRYQYTSFTTPSSVYELDLDSGETTLLKQSKVLGGFNSEDYQSERLWITARDNTKVPVSLVYKKALFKQDNPLLVYAYGAYGESMDISFSPSNLSLLDRGFVYAVAHVRGGEELGRSWYEDGKLLKKQNTFNDFIDVSQALTELGYGAKDKVFAAGGSAGGLLMGAVINQAPDIYKGVVAAVPFVDVVTTMLDESIPLTTGEYDEWGNPNDTDYYHYIHSYSPYDQISEQAYPHMLVTSGLHDSQVQYWEPAKWVAKLRQHKTDDNHLLLYTDMDAGHGGKSGRFQHLVDVAREFAFLIDLAQ